MKVFLYILIVLVAAMMIYVIAAWIRGMIKASAAKESTKLTIFSFRYMAMPLIWLVITGVNIMMKFSELSDRKRLRTELADREFVIMNGNTKEQALSNVESRISETTLGIVFFILCFAVFTVILLIMLRARLSSDGLYWGFSSYKPQNISYIMEEGMERPVLVDRRSGRELGVRSVKDIAACRRILTENYGSAKYYSEREEQSPNEIGSQTED